ncbi:MAG: 1-deoxy-D-xylulose-5-phosphate reductoisomerase [Clostridia bacterium]|nr:1-deoxy-D-xylulose-5-phosphate reductoisomerase [Clostridia bacterium]
MIDKDYSKLKVAVLGSTGSIGTQALDVIRELGCKVVFLSAKSNAELLSRQTEEFLPDAVCLTDPEKSDDFLFPRNRKTELFLGEEAHVKCISSLDVDVIIHAVSGLSGIPSALEASKKGVRLAVANKEAIITLGDVILDNIRKYGGVLIPVDSEHSAIFQCLLTNRGDRSQIKKLILTASGGPFFGYTSEMLSNVTPAMALAHPTWKMGPKITVDSSTLMNKGFEIIEAVRLFDVDESAVEVVVHRQSIIHSMVEYIDSTVIAQLGSPDMRAPILYSLTYPERVGSPVAPLDLIGISKLTFDKPDYNVFPLLNTARRSIREGGVAPATLISADEVAVSSFLDGNITFDKIPVVVEKTLDKASNVNTVSVENVFSAVCEAEKIAKKIIAEL